MTGAIYLDLDGTLAHYDKWRGVQHIGEPVPAMARRLEQWLEQGIPVKIFTARVWSDGSPPRNVESNVAFATIQAWLRQHFGVNLPVTCLKGPDAIAFYDDRAVRIARNLGVLDTEYRE